MWSKKNYKIKYNYYEEPSKTARNYAGVFKSNELYLDSLDRNERYKQEIKDKLEFESRNYGCPKINKKSNKIVNKEFQYIPIHKRIKQVMAKKQMNIDILKTKLDEKARLLEFEEELQRINDINKLSKTLKETRSSRNKNGVTNFKTFKEFISKENIWLRGKQKRQADLNKRKTDNEIKDLYFHPKINNYSPKSSNRSKSKDKANFWERLYYLDSKSVENNFSDSQQPQLSNTAPVFAKIGKSIKKVIAI